MAEVGLGCLLKKVCRWPSEATLLVLLLPVDLRDAVESPSIHVPGEVREVGGRREATVHPPAVVAAHPVVPTSLDVHGHKVQPEFAVAPEQFARHLRGNPLVRPRPKWLLS